MFRVSEFDADTLAALGNPMEIREIEPEELEALANANIDHHTVYTAVDSQRLISIGFLASPEGIWYYMMALANADKILLSRYGHYLATKAGRMLLATEMSNGPITLTPRPRSRGNATTEP